MGEWLWAWRDLFDGICDFLKEARTDIDYLLFSQEFQECMLTVILCTAICVMTSMTVYIIVLVRISGKEQENKHHDTFVNNYPVGRMIAKIQMALTMDK